MSEHEARSLQEKNALLLHLFFFDPACKAEKQARRLIFQVQALDFRIRGALVSVPEREVAR